MKALYFFIAMFALLIGIAMIMPHNSLTGKAVQDDTCGPLGCVKLCEQKVDPTPNDAVSTKAASSSLASSSTSGDTGNVCKKDMVCCQTHWESGVCDYSFNCEKVREYSLYQTLETYKDTVKEYPSPVQPGFDNFYLPLIVIVAIICIVIFKYRNPHQDWHD